MGGIGIEFMVGATLLSFISLMGFLFVAWLIYRVARKVYKHSQDETKETPLNIKWEMVGLAVVMLFSIFFSSASQPKLTINTLPDRELIQYQNNNDEIVIETPKPRTTPLEGFRPLGQ